MHKRQKYVYDIFFSFASSLRYIAFFEQSRSFHSCIIPELSSRPLRSFTFLTGDLMLFIFCRTIFDLPLLNLFQFSNLILANEKWKFCHFLQYRSWMPLTQIWYILAGFSSLCTQNSWRLLQYVYGHRRHRKRHVLKYRILFYDYQMSVVFTFAVYSLWRISELLNWSCTANERVQSTAPRKFMKDNGFCYSLPWSWHRCPGL